ncbi:hypothetical protein F4803DRAFT_524947 [Xylaria telfairii]|nr:hypothetical protein F4803DRAFT_524947 [Xylaria telfairii]
MAVTNRHEAMTKLLLSTGKANANFKDKYDQTPLSPAVGEGREDIVKLLPQETLWL